MFVMSWPKRPGKASAFQQSILLLSMVSILGLTGLRLARVLNRNLAATQVIRWPAVRRGGALTWQKQSSAEALAA